MSRSYRRPHIKDKSKFHQKLANRRVRRLNKSLNQDIGSGNQYKRVYNSYDISDWNFYTPQIKKAYRK